MGSHEKHNGSIEYYTPKYIFDALGVRFDLDVAHPLIETEVPADRVITSNSLEQEWSGFIWMNPPYLNAKNKELWVEKFISHGNGIALMPDRSNAPWFQMMDEKSDLVLYTFDKIKFRLPNGMIAGSPGNNSALFAIGYRGVSALINAQKNGLGFLHKRFNP